MNPLIIIFAIIGGFFLWLFLSFAFKPIGRFLERLFDDAKDAMNEDEKEADDK